MSNKVTFTTIQYIKRKWTDKRRESKTIHSKSGVWGGSLRSHVVSATELCTEIFKDQGKHHLSWRRDTKEHWDTALSLAERKYVRVVATTALVPLLKVSCHVSFATASLGAGWQLRHRNHLNRRWTPAELTHGWKTRRTHSTRCSEGSRSYPGGQTCATHFRTPARSFPASTEFSLQPFFQGCAHGPELACE